MNDITSCEGQHKSYILIFDLCICISVLAYMIKRAYTSELPEIDKEKFCVKRSNSCEVKNKTDYKMLVLKVAIKVIKKKILNMKRSSINGKKYLEYE